jgi:hypothetical protein
MFRIRVLHQMLNLSSGEGVYTSIALHDLRGRER